MPFNIPKKSEKKHIKVISSLVFICMYGKPCFIFLLLFSVKAVCGLFDKYTNVIQKKMLFPKPYDANILLLFAC